MVPLNALNELQHLSVVEVLRYVSIELLLNLQFDLLDLIGLIFS